ncbi:hypothetical protein ACN24K_01680 [Streptomyces microflavus]
MTDNRPIDVQLPPVPRGLQPQELADICRILGFDPAIVRELHIGLYDVTATIYLRTSDGHKIAYGDDAATTTVTIPFDVPHG